MNTNSVHRAMHFAMQKDFCEALKKLGKCDYGDCDSCSINVAMRNKRKELGFGDRIVISTYASSAYSSSHSSEKSSSHWIVTVVVVCIIVICLYALNSEKMTSSSWSQKMSPNQTHRTYIANTYEAFAKAKVGDWYRDIHHGNVARQVTQGDINWAKQKLNEQRQVVSASETTSATSAQNVGAPTATASFENRVKAVAKKSRAIDSIGDIDNDGQINSCDRALYFYWYWKKNYSEPCQLVVNYKKGYMNHIFLRILYNGKWYEIEPEIKNPLEFSDYWREKYDAAFNIYQGQTNYKWLSDDYVQPVMRRLDKNGR